MDFVFDKEKLRELIVYVARKCDAESDFGATKLNKVLFFADFLSYRQFGRPITGAPYRKLQFGPAPTDMVEILSELESEGSIVRSTSNYMGYPLKKVTALRDAKTELFSGSDIALVDQVMAFVSRTTAATISEVSHKFSVGWQIAKMGEEIPYPSVFLSPRPISQTEAALVVAESQRLGFSRYLTHA